MAIMLKLSPKQYKMMVKLLCVYWEGVTDQTMSFYPKYPGIAKLVNDYGWDRFWLSCLYDLCDNRLTSANILAIQNR